MYTLSDSGRLTESSTDAHAQPAPANVRCTSLCDMLPVAVRSNSDFCHARAEAGICVHSDSPCASLLGSVTATPINTNSPPFIRTTSNRHRNGIRRRSLFQRLRPCFRPTSFLPVLANRAIRGASAKSSSPASNTLTSQRTSQTEVSQR